jgi:serine-type D-Ala-D-Ala carboxypeptidase/endopeptidase (penicillin-binding protein 4)
MRLTRRPSTRLLGCSVLSIAAFVCTATSSAQSRPSLGQNSQRAAPAAHSPERPDVARFSRRLEMSLAAPGPDKGFWGVLVTDAATGEVLYARNDGNYFAPASNAKLFTTALALATLGPNHRTHTTLTTSGTIDGNGVLNGDLVLTGSADANLSNRIFPYEKRPERKGPPEKALAEFADAVAARGIKEITGNIVVDDSLFQPERFPSGWAIDDMQWSYGGAVSAIVVNDNTFTIELWPGDREGEPARYDAGLATDFYTIENSVRTTARGTEEKLAVTRDPGSRLVWMTGTVPAGENRRVLTLAVEQPAEYVATLLGHLLALRGVKTDGATRARHFGDPPLPVSPDHAVLLDRTSVPLSDDVRLTNKESENIHAELLLLLAAHEKTGATTYEDALKFATGFYTSAGIDGSDLVLSDGSGLSRKDMVTPRAIVQILRYAASQPWAESYRSSLPVAAEDGTLAARMKNTAAAGRVFAKTGTIGHVNALSGYATTLSGAHLIFSIVGNNNNLKAQAADAVLDAIAVAMVEELEPAAEMKRKK